MNSYMVGNPRIQIHKITKSGPQEREVQEGPVSRCASRFREIWNRREVRDVRTEDLCEIDPAKLAVKVDPRWGDGYPSIE